MDAAGPRELAGCFETDALVGPGDERNLRHGGFWERPTVCRLGGQTATLARSWGAGLCESLMYTVD